MALYLQSGVPCGVVWLAYRYLDLLSVVLSSTPRPCGVNSQLVSLPLVGTLNSLWSI